MYTKLLILNNEESEIRGIQIEIERFRPRRRVEKRLESREAEI